MAGAGIEPPTRGFSVHVSAAVIGEQRTASDDLGKQKLYLETRRQPLTCPRLFQKEIHAVEIDDGMIVVQRIDP
jgi:hypothetical protein